MEDLLDVAIVGSGPAGISAALTAKTRNKKIMLFGSSKVSEKIMKADEINNYPGFYGISGADLTEKFSLHAKSMGISITEEKISGIYKIGNSFSLISGKNQYQSKTVIIAIGTGLGKLYNGEVEFLGKGVSYCATCDGMLHRDKTVAVIAESKDEEKEVDFLAGICRKVYYIPLYKDFSDFSNYNNIEIIFERPLKILGKEKAQELAFKEHSIKTDCIFILRNTIFPNVLLSGLKMKDNFIETDKFQKTNIPGCFAAGDITGSPFQIGKAVGEGNIAALSAVDYIFNIEKSL